MTRKYLYPLCSRSSNYALLPSALPDGLPVADKSSNQVLCLPIYGTLPVSTVEKISAAIRYITLKQMSWFLPETILQPRI